MKLNYPILLLIALLFCSNAAFSQGQIYRYDSTIKIFAAGKQKKMAWCGGFNSPQFALADLNKDGKKDLAIFERGTGVRTFINTGVAGAPNYVFAPEYEINFPEIAGSMKLIDYNCDGIPDLVTSGGSFALWRGYYNSKNQLSFTFYEGLSYSNDTLATGTQNAWVSPGDIPEVIDVDHDGDLDFIAFDINGNQVAYYKNVRNEEGLPCDSVRIKLKDQCWGKFYQNYILSNVLHHHCDNTNLILSAGEKVTHTGNSICLLDMDGDGDYDMLNGEVGFSNLVYLQNGRLPYNSSGPDSMVYQDSTWNKSGFSVNMQVFPAPYYLDIDQDGKKDLLIAPNDVGENYRCIMYLKNIGYDSLPNFVYQGDSFLIDQAIDVGTAAYPMFYDYNKDGKPDLFIGSDGYRQADGTYRAQISYYLNTSVLDTPSFVLQTTDFLGLSAYNFQGTALSVGDIDNDGKTDLVVGHTGGTLSYFKNTASSNNVQPNWQLGQVNLKDNKGAVIIANGNGYAAPFVYDLDKDGKPDLLIGGAQGYLQYYRNTSVVPGQVSLQLINDSIGHIKTDGPNTSGYSTPFIGKVDSTGVDYLLVGSRSGLLYRFTGFQTGDTTGTYPMLDQDYSYIDTAHLYALHNGNYNGLRSAVAIADVDGNGKLEMVVGDLYGGLILYEQDSLAKDTSLHLNVANQEVDKKVEIYPNPTNNTTTIWWAESFSKSLVNISLLNTTGQTVFEETVNAVPYHTKLSLDAFPPGVYYCVVRSETASVVLRLSLIK